MHKIKKIVSNEFLKKHGIGISALLLLLIIAIYNNRLINDESVSLIKHKVITTGRVTYIDYFPRGSGSYINYEFISENGTIKNRKRIFIENRNKLKSILLGESMPVIYDETDVSNNQIIKSMEDCVEYNVKVDDKTKITLMRLDSMLITN